MLFKTIPTTQQEAIDAYMNDPKMTYTKKKLKGGASGKKYDLTKEFWINVPPELYPVDPAQQKLFDVRQRMKTATTGKKQITMGPAQTAAQMRLLGG